ncbi:AraC family transcriptional regulator [Pseudomonas sp. MPC6]|uniref:AraC family transcriptional regulator n=1 Tax=unclassified Pseudomonas TaxID=196821 RepID=UPI001110708E|nr:AraC family transcriptional regulator [Pseudomonas sp. MPC6]QCY09431.1 AraC family transcriptional regulator [Pseudomonas sp. MPC6]
MQNKTPSDIATVSASVAVDLAAILRREGFDPKPLFDQADIDLKAIDDPYQTVRLDNFTHLLELAALLTKRPMLGLELGAQQNPAKWGAFGYVVLNSPTVGAALYNMATFLKSSQGGTRMAYINRGDRIGIEYAILHPKVVHKNQDAEFAMAYVKHVVDQLCEHSVTPSGVYFQHDPLGDISTYQKLLGITPYFDQPVNTITYSATLEDKPVPSADLKLFPIIKKHLIDLINSAPDDFDLIASVSYHIRQTLPGGQSRLENVANIMAIGPRTLQRQLKEQGINFAQILDNTRRELAIQNIEALTMEIKEISFLLGFSDTSAFIKAFKKWTGETPAKYRNKKA